MELWDIIKGKNVFMLNEEQKDFEHEQTLISVKETKNLFSVEREYVNSYVYHEKFMNLPISKTLQESLYMECGRLLEFVDNLPEEKMGEERMSAIDFRTGELIVDNFNRIGEVERTGFTEEEARKIGKCPNSVVLIHNHSKNDIPSGQDLLTYLQNEKIKLSIIACHNGDLYAICGVKKSFETIYNEFLNEEKTKTTDNKVAKRRATTRIYQLNDDLSERHKLFVVLKYL